jgi:hypothetical protein
MWSDPCLSSTLFSRTKVVQCLNSSASFKYACFGTSAWHASFTEGTNH